MRTEGGATDGANLPRIQFERGASRLPLGSEQVEPISVFLAAHPEVTKLRIEGHTSNTGTAKKALALSGRRALAAKDALIALGVDGERLVAVGFGRDRPVADNATAAGRALNERVEFQIAERNGEPVGDVTGGGQIFPETPPAGVVDKYGGHVGADGFYYDRFGGYYDKDGYYFKDGSYKSRCGDRYDVPTQKFFNSKDIEFVPAADLQLESLEDKRGYLNILCAVAQYMHKEDEAASRKRRK